jgi:copper homeostasis protein
MSQFTFEICAANLASAIAAQQGGGHRIELCSALSVGGLTPSPGMIEMAVQALTIPVCVLIRPREGHFVYTSDEVESMLRDIHFCKKASAKGIVIGALTNENRIDGALMATFKAAAKGIEMVLHRAFDLCADPLEALDSALSCGVVRILTSGQAPTALEGAILIRQLQLQAKDRIEIMPGGGITPENIGDIARLTGCRNFHFSAKQAVNVLGKNELPGLEAGYAVSDAGLIGRYLTI